MRGKLSIVLPAYNEGANIAKSYYALEEILDKAEIPFEIIYVNDGSKDDTWGQICKMIKQTEENNICNQIKGINFSRNFGKESAVMAGLANAEGEACVVMDCDLQHPPECVSEMYALWEEGYEVVEGMKRSRGRETIVHKKCAEIFYQLMSKALKIDMEGASDFKLLDRKVVNVLLSMPERNIFFRGLSSWVGFKKTTVLFDVREREEGESKWSRRALIKYAIKNIAAFSTVPLQFTTIAGIVTFFVAVILGIQTLLKYFNGNAVEGFTTVICLVLFTASIIMTCLGIIGYYIAKIYEEVKRRPVYIVSEIIKTKSE